MFISRWAKVIDMIIPRCYDTELYVRQRLGSIMGRESMGRNEDDSQRLLSSSYIQNQCMHMDNLFFRVPLVVTCINFNPIINK